MTPHLVLASSQLVPQRIGSTSGAGGGGGGGGGGGAVVGEGAGGFMVGPEGPASPEQGSSAGPAGGVGVGVSEGPLMMAISAQFLSNCRIYVCKQRCVSFDYHYEIGLHVLKRNTTRPSRNLHLTRIARERLHHTNQQDRGTWGDLWVVIPRPQSTCHIQGLNMNFQFDSTTEGGQPGH